MKQSLIGLTIVLSQLSFTDVAAQTKYIQAVDEYVPAPGQFVNTLPVADENDTPETMARKCTERLAGGAGEMVTLGAYGGYIVFHFDHPVANIQGQRDFAVWGNAFDYAAEPAIVMVAVDANGNGLPDDEWYELRGSEYDNPLTQHHYRLTYTYSPLADVQWTDNQGVQGSVPRNTFHSQEYFPLWLTAQESLTFTGARLPDNAYLEGKKYLLPAYDYGYADNQPNDNIEGCSMDISWAVDADGRPVSLSHIDVVKCYNAMNQVCGSIGETSTEITGAEDLHLEASIEQAEGISEIVNSKSSNCKSSNSKFFDLQGRRMGSSHFSLPTSHLKKGLYIRNGKKHIY